MTLSEVHIDAELEARALSSDRRTRRLQRTHGERALVLKDLRLVREMPLVSEDEFTALVKPVHQRETFRVEHYRLLSERPPRHCVIHLLSC